MQLREFTLITPIIEAGQVFKAIEGAISIELIHDTIAKSQCQSQRQRKLPAHLVVCLVIAFSFWSKAAMRDVLKNLTLFGHISERNLELGIDHLGGC